MMRKMNIIENKQLWNAIPSQYSQATSIVNELKKLFKYHPQLKVIEIGGSYGNLANKMLSEFSDIAKWDNFELIEYNQHIVDPRYSFTVIDKDIINYIGEYDVVVVSHVFEFMQLDEIYTILSTKIRWIYAEINYELFINHPLLQNKHGIHWFSEELPLQRNVASIRNNTYIFTLNNTKMKYKFQHRGKIPYPDPNHPKVHAWVSEKEIEKLVNMAKDKIYCEIGTFEGFSASRIVPVSSKSYLIDPLNEARFQLVMKNVIEPNIDRVNLKRDLSQHVYRSIKDHTLDVILIDGSHHYTDVRRDYFLYRGKVKTGGFICFHDYTRMFGGVVRTVNIDVEDDFVEQCESLIIFRKNEKRLSYTDETYHVESN
jgi:predicted O-methyltransferase YrrM